MVQNTLIAMAALCAAGVLLTLVMGVLNMGGSSHAQHKKSNSLMRVRIILQTAVIFFLILITLLK